MATIEQPADLVRVGLFTVAEFRKFERAERFFWAVRCHLHLAANRAEERLGFDHQKHIAEVMRYADASAYHILWSDVVLIEAGAIGHSLDPIAEQEPR